MIIPLSHILSRHSFRTFNSWSLAIKNASKSTTPQKALQLYVQMYHQHRPYLDTFSILYALKSCTQSLNLPLTHQFHAHIIKLGFHYHIYVATSMLHAYVTLSFLDACKLFDEIPVRNTVTYNTMITGFSQYGYIKEGRQIFDQMPNKDLASWSAMIAAYMNNGIWNEGLSLFRKVLVINSKEFRPDRVMLGTVLAACARMGTMGLELGKCIHSFVIRTWWELGVELGTCLVDMYAKCGELKNARLVFDTMRDKNVVAWTALISGAAQHGHGKEALVIFEGMKESGVRPNELTFTGVLSACVQVGLVEEGRRYFRMIEGYGLKPSIQHYGCMVDLFGKAGLLDEAYEVINTMQFEPNVVIWGSFLSSCKLHKQFRMAERVIDRVFRTIKPENDGGVYTLISDLYVLNDKWGDAERMRQLMINQNVRKARGSSFIRNATT